MSDIIINQSKYNSDWEPKKLFELGTFSRGISKHRPRNDNILFVGGGYPFIQTGDIRKANLFLTHHVEEYGEFGLKQSKLWPTGTLCITIAANIAETAILAYPMCFPDSVVGFIANAKSSSELFMYYIFEYIKNGIKTAASGSAQDNINIDYLSSIKFKIPKKTYQDKIVAVLSSVDKKISLNNLINDNLEQQLRTIYDYWFTQFDFPDENGKPYRSSGGKMVWNEELKRLIPEGWSVMPLLNYVTWESNSQPPKSEFVYTPKKGYVRFIQNRDYDSDGYKTYIPYKHSLSMVDKFDILMDKYGDAGAIRYGIAGAFNVALGKICVHDADMQEYIRSYLGSAAVYNHLHNSCMASTRASLSENNLSFLKIIVPSKELLRKYQEMAHKMRSLILDCSDQNRQCVAIRDWLLPMLMNGQATVAD